MSNRDDQKRQNRGAINASKELRSPPALPRSKRTMSKTDNGNFMPDEEVDVELHTDEASGMEDDASSASGLEDDVGESSTAPVDRISLPKHRRKGFTGAVISAPKAEKPNRRVGKAPPTGMAPKRRAILSHKQKLPPGEPDSSDNDAGVDYRNLTNRASPQHQQSPDVVEQKRQWKRTMERLSKVDKKELVLGNKQQRRKIYAYLGQPWTGPEMLRHQTGFNISANSLYKKVRNIAKSELPMAIREEERWEMIGVLIRCDLKIPDQEWAHNGIRKYHKALVMLQEQADNENDYDVSEMRHVLGLDQDESTGDELEAPPKPAPAMKKKQKAQAGSRYKKAAKSTKVPALDQDESTGDELEAPPKPAPAMKKKQKVQASSVIQTPAKEKPSQPVNKAKQFHHAKRKRLTEDSGDGPAKKGARVESHDRRTAREEDHNGPEDTDGSDMDSDLIRDEDVPSRMKDQSTVARSDRPVDNTSKSTQSTSQSSTTQDGSRNKPLLEGTKTPWDLASLILGADSGDDVLSAREKVQVLQNLVVAPRGGESTRIEDLEASPSFKKIISETQAMAEGKQKVNLTNLWTFVFAYPRSKSSNGGIPGELNDKLVPILRKIARYLYSCLSKGEGFDPQVIREFYTPLYRDYEVEGKGEEPRAIEGSPSRNGIDNPQRSSIPITDAEIEQERKAAFKLFKGAGLSFDGVPGWDDFIKEHEQEASRKSDTQRSIPTPASSSSTQPTGNAISEETPAIEGSSSGNRIDNVPANPIHKTSTMPDREREMFTKMLANVGLSYDGVEGWGDDVYPPEQVTSPKLDTQRPTPTLAPSSSTQPTGNAISAPLKNDHQLRREPGDSTHNEKTLDTQVCTGSDGENWDDFLNMLECVPKADHDECINDIQKTVFEKLKSMHGNMAIMEYIGLHTDVSLVAELKDWIKKNSCQEG